MEQSIPQAIARMDAKRLGRYREYLAFYQGKQWAGSPRARERRLTFNYAKTIVEKITSYLMQGAASVVDPVDGGAEAAAAASRAEAALRSVAEANALEQLDFDTEIDCAVLGDAAYKVTWDPAVGIVRVTSPDVQGLFAWWQAGDPARLRRVVSRYEMATDEATELLAGARPSPPAGSGRAATVVEAWTEATFELWVDGRAARSEANPYGFIPFVIYPNLREPKEFWGSSDIPAIIESSRELNRALSQLSMILELSGNPVAVLENVTDTQDIAVAPGAVWELPERAKAYLLDLLHGGGVQLHIDYVNLVYRTLHDLGESPRTAFGENREALSGVALAVEMDPLLKKVQRKRLTRSAAYRRRNEMVLRLLERFTGEPFAPYRSRIVWGPVLPPDRSRLVADEKALVEAGIHSRRRAADELGVNDPETELARWLEEEARMNGVVPSDGTGRR